MEHAVEIGSGAMTYIPGFIKIGSTIQKIIWRDTYTDKHAQTAKMMS
jgi:hypothetical protein